MIPNDRFARFRNEVFKLLDGRGTLSDPTLIFSNLADSAEVENKQTQTPRHSVRGAVAKSVFRGFAPHSSVS